MLHNTIYICRKIQNVTSKIPYNNGQKPEKILPKYCITSAKKKKITSEIPYTINKKNPKNYLSFNIDKKTESYLKITKISTKKLNIASKPINRP